MKTQEAWLQWLEKRCAYQPIQLGLERVRQVAARLHVGSFDVPVVLVGGTNGKGSTVRALQALYQHAGYVVGVYTSPHLFQFNERIVVNEQLIEASALCEAFQAVYEAEQDCVLTYFEFTTLAAFWHFKRMQPDVLLLEVGLGGRLDATNLVDADVAILTTIDFDHQAYLGDTIEAIGFEKAGILRAKQQAIFAATSPPSSVLDRASHHGTQLICYQQDYMDLISSTHYRFCSPEFEWQGRLPKLHHQAISAAIMASRLLQERLPVPLQAYEVLPQAQLMGRLQLIPGKIDMLFDVSHNLQSVQRLADYIAHAYAGCKIHAIFSALSDKPIAEMVACLVPLIDCWHLCVLDGARAASLEQLRQACAIIPQQSILWYNGLDLAYDGVTAQRCAPDVLVVFGSFLTVAEVLMHHSRQADSIEGGLMGEKDETCHR